MENGTCTAVVWKAGENCEPVLRAIEDDLVAQVSSLRQQHPSFSPRLAIVQVGGREDSNVYIRMKLRAAERIGIQAEHVKLPRDITENELLARLTELNESPAVHGIIVQMPLDSQFDIDGHKVTDAVSPHKDVDGCGMAAVLTKRKKQNLNL